VPNIRRGRAAAFSALHHAAEESIIYSNNRAKRLVVLVGSKRAIAIAVKNNKVQHSYTNLAARLSMKPINGS